MITLRRLQTGDIPESIVRHIVSWGDKEILIDENGLTAGQITKLKELFEQDGYKVV